MRTSKRSIRPASWAVVLLASCAPIKYSAQEVVLRHDAEADELDVLILYEGIQTGRQDRGKDEIDVASRFTGRVALGWREFMICDWPLHHDLEEIVKELGRVDDDAKDPWSAWKREGLEHLEGIRVVASGLYAGDEGRVSLYQHFRIDHASRLVEWLDRSLRIWIAEWDAKGTLEEHLPHFDSETRAAWVELSKRKARWLTLANGGIDVKLPMSPADTARILPDLIIKQGDPDGAKFFATLTEPLAEVEVASGFLHLAWKAEEGVVRFRFSGTEKYDERLAKEMRSADEFPPKLPTRADVVRHFGGN